MSDIVAVAKASGLSRIEVTANPGSTGFYEKLGFVFSHDVATELDMAPRLYLDLTPQAS